MPPLNLPAPLSPQPRFLLSGASVHQRVQATVKNHIEWFTTLAQMSGSIVRREPGVVLIGPGINAGRGGVAAFPRLDALTAGETLDRMMTFFRERRTTSADTGSVAVWATLPTRPRDLGARLMARGFEHGWQPHWMAADLRRLNTDFPVPDTLEITVDDEADWNVSDLPYFSRDDVPVWQTLARQKPRRLWHFAARLNGQIVGHSILFLTTGSTGVAGIYSVGVVPSARNRGIGRAVSLAACSYARALGANYAVLNAATHIYEHLGFESLGFGQTWWMHERMFSQPAPIPAQIAFVEALGTGNKATLNDLPPQTFPADWNAPLLCGHTPVKVAVKLHQPRAAQWLEARGATLSPIDCWDLGWKARVHRTLARNPAVVNAYSVGGVRTPVHEAAGRGDLELISLLLTAQPDLTLRDKEFNGTALNWAQHGRHAAATQLLADYEHASGLRGG